MVINKMKSDEIISFNEIILLSQDTNSWGKNSDKGFFKRTRKVLFPDNLDTRYTVSNKIGNLTSGVDSLASLPINMDNKLRIRPKRNRMDKKQCFSKGKKQPQLKSDKLYRKKLKDQGEREKIGVIVSTLKMKKLLTTRKPDTNEILDVLGKLPKVQSLQSRKFNIKKSLKKGKKIVEKVSQILNVRNEKEKGNQHTVMKINCGTPLTDNYDSDTATDSLAIIPKKKISRYCEIEKCKQTKKEGRNQTAIELPQTKNYSSFKLITPLEISTNDSVDKSLNADVKENVSISCITVKRNNTRSKIKDGKELAKVLFSSPRCSSGNTCPIKRLVISEREKRRIDAKTVLDISSLQLTKHYIAQNNKNEQNELVTHNLNPITSKIITPPKISHTILANESSEINSKLNVSFSCITNKRNNISEYVRSPKELGEGLLSSLRRSERKKSRVERLVVSERRLKKKKQRQSEQKDQYICCLDPITSITKPSEINFSSTLLSGNQNLSILCSSEIQKSKEQNLLQTPSIGKEKVNDLLIPKTLLSSLRRSERKKSRVDKLVISERRLKKKKQRQSEQKDQYICCLDPITPITKPSEINFSSTLLSGNQNLSILCSSEVQKGKEQNLPQTPSIGKEKVNAILIPVRGVRSVRKRKQVNRLVISERRFKQKKIRRNGTKKDSPLVQLNDKKKSRRTSNNVQETSKASETITEQETNEVSKKKSKMEISDFTDNRNYKQHDITKKGRNKVLLQETLRNKLVIKKGCVKGKKLSTTQKKRRVYKHQNVKVRRDHVEINKHQAVCNGFKDGEELLQCQKKIKEIKKVVAKTNKQDSSDEEDDIFDSTPLRNVLFGMLSSKSKEQLTTSAQILTAPSCDLGSPISKSQEDIICTSQYLDDDIDSSNSPIHFQKGYKRYINKMRVGFSLKVNKDRLKGKQKWKKKSSILLAKVNAGELHMNGSLSPGGSMKINAPDELELEDLFINSGDEFSGSDEEC